jgi:AAA domain, putative AbiEii toxin, Type IV TA system
VFNDEDRSSMGACSLSAHFRHGRVEKGPSLAEMIRHGVTPPITMFIDIVLVLGLSTFKIEIANNKVVTAEGDVQILEFDAASLLPVISLAIIRNRIFQSGRVDVADVFTMIVDSLTSRETQGRLDESLDVIRAGMARWENVFYSDTFETYGTLSSPTDLRRALMASATANSEQLSAKSDDVEFLRDFAQLVDADFVKTTFNRQSVEDFEDVRRLTFHNQNFSIQRGKSVTYFEQFSYGQKRLLGILQYLAVNQEIVVADEITNGLHHEWIDFIVKKLEGRQCFLTSQNPVLLDFLTFTSAAETQNRLIRCEHGLNGTLIWRNLTDEEANDFYTSYETGMQHVGEIMRKQGLW